MIDLPFRHFVLRAVLVLLAFAGGGNLWLVARGKPVAPELIVGGVLAAIGLLVVGLVVHRRRRHHRDA